MAWLLVKIQANEKNADLISNALMELGALSVSIEDAHAKTINEEAIFDEPDNLPLDVWQQSVVTAMLDTFANVDALIKQLEAMVNNKINYTTETIAEQDWVRLTQAQFAPINIADKIWIVPTWHEPPNKDAINIILDPGLAFGTGSHPTTHLCLQWLAEQSHLENVLDYGAGSGILAIAAKKLGAKQVTGIDIDPQAIIASDYNAKQNNVDINFLDANTSIKQVFDIVVANILSGALMVLAPVLAKHCKTNAKIALSGILIEQADALINRYNEWFIMGDPIQKDAWVLLTGTKK